MTMDLNTSGDGRATFTLQWQIKVFAVLQLAALKITSADTFAYTAHEVEIPLVKCTLTSEGVKRNKEHKVIWSSRGPSKVV